MDKYRHEYKYLIDPGQRRILLMKAQAMMQRDPHAGDDGRIDVPVSRVVATSKSN